MWDKVKALFDRGSLEYLSSVGSFYQSLLVFHQPSGERLLGRTSPRGSRRGGSVLSGQHVCFCTFMSTWKPVLMSPSGWTRGSCIMSIIVSTNLC